MLALGHAPRLFTANFGDIAFQVAQSRFARVVPNQFLNGIVTELDILAQADSVLLHLPGDDVPYGDLDLLLLRVTWDFQNLHAVTERFRNGVEDVGRRDK